MTSRLFLLAAVGLCAFAQSSDVHGWDKITWGMTMADARAAYHTEAKPEVKDDWTLLQLKPIKMGGVQLGVQVGAREGSEKIASIRLWSYFGLSNSQPGAGAQDFDTLRSILIEKYGQPANEETTHGENFRIIKTIAWTFPSTSISMKLEASTSIPNLGNIDLVYTPR
ncbi:MAG TPA: hypothetical protein VFW44_05835 [Bryobacteraceae bacterium]|nr:hypothetical protein [Bryobacteraceae bacterium]